MGRMALEPFDYRGVTMKPSRWQRQYADARDFYFNIPNDDILRGFREDAGMASPGQALGGWCSHESYEVLGHWLQAMARASRATDDSDLRAKAEVLMVEWGKTLDLNPDGSGRTRFQQILAGSERGSHYYFDKMAGGLVDMHQYAGRPEARPLLEKITEWGTKLLRRDRVAGITGRFSTGMVHAGGEFVSRLRGDGRRPIPRFRGSVALSGLLESFPDDVAPGAHLRAARLQPLQHFQQRGDGVSGHGRSAVFADNPERV
jgi:hypothetical protein